MSEANITPARSEDADAVVELWTACGLTRPWNDPHQDFQFALQGATSTVLQLRSGSELLGAVMVGHDGHRGAVYYLGVSPDRRQSGFGRRLMSEAEQWLRDRGVWKLNLLVRDTNAATLAFYERLGYGDQSCIAMGKRLDGRDDRRPQEER